MNELVNLKGGQGSDRQFRLVTGTIGAKAFNEAVTERMKELYLKGRVVEKKSIKKYPRRKLK